MSSYMSGRPAEARTGRPESSDESGTETSLTQLTLDDLEAGRRQRDRGHQVSTYGTDVQWRSAFDTVLERLASTCETVTVYDVLAEVGYPPQGSSQSFGALMSAAARRGVITKTGAVVQSPKSSRHGGWVFEWRQGGA